MIKNLSEYLPKPKKTRKQMEEEAKGRYDFFTGKVRGDVTPNPHTAFQPVKPFDLIDANRGRDVAFIPKPKKTEADILKDISEIDREIGQSYFYDDYETAKLNKVKFEMQKELSAMKAERYSKAPLQKDFVKLSVAQDGEKDKNFNYINNRGHYKDETMKAFAVLHGKEYEFMYHMSDEEKKIYNYLYNKNGKDDAENYLKTLEKDLSRRAGERMAEGFGDNTVGKVAFSALAGAENMVTGIRQNLSNEAVTRSPIEHAGQKLRQDLEGLPAFAYDAGQMLGNMAPSAGASLLTKTPLVGTALMGLSAKGNAQHWALENGYDPGQAIIYGLVIGTLEAGLQTALGGITKLGGGGVLMKAAEEKVKAISNAALRFVSKYAISAVSEGVEEGLQEVLDPIIKTAVLNEKYTPAKVEDVAYSALLGMVGSLFFEGGEIAGQELANRRTGKEVAKSGKAEVQAVAEAGQNLSPDTAGYTVAQRIGERIRKNKVLSLSDIGLVANEVGRAAERGEATQAERVQKVAEKLGREVVFYQNDNTAQNGYFKGGVIHINANSQNPIPQVFSHELTHSIELSENYGEFSELILSRLSAQNTLESDLNAKITAYKSQGVDLSIEDAKAELVAEYVEKNLFTNEKEIARLAGEKPTLAKRVLNWIDRVLAKFGNEDAKERIFLENARNLYVSALNTSGNAENIGEGGQFSIKDGVTQGSPGATDSSTTNGDTAYFSGASNHNTSQADSGVKPKFSISSYEHESPDAEALKVAEEMRTEPQIAPAYRKRKPHKQVSYSQYNYNHDIYSDVDYMDSVDLLKEMNESPQYKKVTLDNLTDESKVHIGKTERRLIRDVKRQLGAHKYIDVASVKDSVREITEEYLDTGSVSNTTVERVFKRMAEEAVIRNDEFYREYKGLKNGLKNIGIRIDESVGHDIPNFYSLKEFKRKAFGVMRIANDGLAVDIVYPELSERYPDLFPADITHQGEQVYQIYQVAKAIKVSEDNVSDILGDEALLEIRESSFKASVKEMTRRLNILQRYEVDVDMEVARRKERGDTNNPEMAKANLAEVKKEIAKMEAKKKNIRERYLLSKKDIELATDFANGRITREALIGSTKNADATLKYGIAEAKKLERMKEAKHFQGQLDAQRIAYTNEQKKLRKEWAKEGFKTNDEVQKAHTMKKQLSRSRDKITKKLKDFEYQLYLDLVTGNIRGDDVVRESANYADIFAAFNLQKEIDLISRKLDESRKKVNRKFFGEALDDVSGIESWKDKSMGILYNRETTLRNIDDIIPDRAKAEYIKDKYFYEISKREAERKRYMNELKKEVEALGLSRKIEKGNTMSESAMVQFLGEKRYEIAQLEAKENLTETEKNYLEVMKNDLERFARENNNFDMEKIETAIAKLHDIYDRLFVKTNEAYLAIGHETIEYRKNYFPHFIDKELVVEDFFTEQKKVFESAFGYMTSDDILPTAIAGMTHSFKPNSPWLAHALERTGSLTEYDALTGFDRYLMAATDVIFLSEPIKRLRVLERAIRVKTSSKEAQDQMAEIIASDDSDNVKAGRMADLERSIEPTHMNNFVMWLTRYANNLSNKKSEVDRLFEIAGNRKVYRFFGNLNKRIAANMVGGNIGSALTNLVPLADAMDEIGPIQMAKALQWYIKDTAEARESFENESVFLTNRKGYDGVAMKATDKIGKKLSIPMEMIDLFSANILVRARYNQNISNGLSHEVALEEADRFALSVMAGRSKGEMPLVFTHTNPVTKAFTMFQLEVNNYLSFLFKDTPRMHREEKGKKLVLRFMRIFLAHWLFNELFEYIRGRGPAFDPIDILNDTFGDITGYKIPNTIYSAENLISGKGVSFETERKKSEEVVYNLGRNIAEELPFVGGFLGGGRIPVNGGLPNRRNVVRGIFGEMDIKKKAEILGKEFMKPVYYIAPPFAGGQLKKAVEGLTTYAQGGKYSYDSEGNKVIDYPVKNRTIAEKVGNFFRLTAMGASSIDTAGEWRDRGFKGLNARQTVAYEEMVRSGISREDAFNYALGIKGNEREVRNTIGGLPINDEAKEALYLGAIEKMKYYDSHLSFLNEAKERGYKVGKLIDTMIDVANEEQTNGKRWVLLASSLPEEEKEFMLRYLYATDKEEETVDSFKDSGMTLDDYLDVAVKKYAFLTQGKNPLAFMKYLNRKGYTEEQKDIIYKAYGMSKKVKTYEGLLDSGLENSSAEAIYEKLQKLKKNKTSDKLKTISGSDLSEAEKQKAVLAVTSKDDKDKVDALFESGIKVEDYQRYFVQKELTYKEMAKGIPATAKVKKVLDGMDIPLESKAIIWQIENSGKKGVVNPYSKNIGIKLAMKEKAKKKKAGLEKLKEKYKVK